MRITGGKVFDLETGFAERDVCFDGELVAEASPDGEVFDASGCYVIPGLTDVHFHGCKGADFSDGDPGGLAVMSAYELSRGITQICPAGMTLPEDQLLKICRAAAEHRRSASPARSWWGSTWRAPSCPRRRRVPRTGPGSTPPTRRC